MTWKQKTARGKRVQSKGQKRNFTKEDVQLIRADLSRDMSISTRSRALQLALLETAVSTCLRAGDVLALKLNDVSGGGGLIFDRIDVMQQKTKRVVSVTFEEEAKQALRVWLGFLRSECEPHSNPRLFGFTRQHYGRLVKEWAVRARLHPRGYSTHSMRRTTPAHVYMMTGNIKACADLLGHANLGHTSRYLGLDINDALKIKSEHKV